MELPTMKISDGDGGYIVINESDYSPTDHQVYEPPKPKTRKTQPVDDEAN